MPFARISTIKRALSMLRKRGLKLTLAEKPFLTRFGEFFKPLKFITAGIGSAFFYLFILEEAVQTAGFGVSVLMNKKLWKEAAVQNRRYRDIAALGMQSVHLLSLDFLREEADFTDEELNLQMHGALQFTSKLSKEEYENSQGILELVFMPFSEFFEAAVETSEMYDAAIAGETQQVGPAYKKQLDELKKRFADDKFKLRLAHDERLDRLGIEKAMRADELAVAKKREENELASDIKAEFASELIDAVQAIRRLLDDDLEKVNAELNKEVLKTRQKLNVDLSDVAQKKIDAAQLVQRTLDDDLEKINAELADKLDAIEAVRKEKNITNEEADTLKEQARAEAEDKKDALRVVAQEQTQAIRQDPSNAAGILKDAADKKITELRNATEQKRDSLRQGAEDAIQAQRKAAFEVGHKGKLTPRERADKKLVIKVAYDKKDLELKAEFNERDRAEKEVHDAALDALGKIFHNEKAELRQKFFPAKLSRQEIEALIGKDTNQFNAVVERVVDGDTIIVKGFYVRLLGINAAEADTEEGQENKAHLKGLIEGKVVTVKTDPANKFDHFDRLLGMIFLGDANISLHMLETCRAFLFTLGENSLVNKEVFGAAANRCFEKTPPAIKVPEVAPVIEPTPAPAPMANITVHVERKDGTPFRDADVTIGGTSPIPNADGNYVRDFTIPNSTRIIVRTFGNIFIAPDVVQQIDFTIAFNESQTHTIIVGTKEEIAPAPPQTPEPLPSDNNGIQGAAASVEFGLLDPPRALGDAGSTTANVIKSQRTFTLAEVADTSHEILMVRLTLTGPFTNTVPLDVDYKLLRPDGTILIVPESAAEIVGIPSSQGFQFWNWTKHGAVFNGDGGDLRGKGRYKLTLLIDGGNPPSGFYELWFDVV